MEIQAVVASSAPVVVVQLQLLTVERKETEGERLLRIGLALSRMEHTYSMCQVLGIYPT